MTENEYMKSRYKKFASEGKCTSCGKPMGEDKHRLCEKCRTKQNAAQKEIRRRRAAAGLCPYCGTPLKDDKYKYCFNCRLKSTERTLAKYYRKKAAKDDV